MGTYALGCFLQDHNTDKGENSTAASVIRSLRNAGKLKALPITRTDKTSGALIAADGTRLFEYGVAGSGRWIPEGELMTGSVCYLGSASHAGHIELKALWVRVEDQWFNIVSGLPQTDEAVLGVTAV